MRYRIVLLVIITVNCYFIFGLFTQKANPVQPRNISVQPTPEGIFGDSPLVFMYKAQEEKWTHTPVVIGSLNYVQALAKPLPPPTPEIHTMPSEWVATATCEEGGRNDSNYGYFGIKEWNGFGGYSLAGDAPLEVQLAWEAAHHQGPPDAPGQCHSY